MGSRGAISTGENRLMIWADSKQVNEVVGLCRRRPDIINRERGRVRVRWSCIWAGLRCYDGGCSSDPWYFPCHDTFQAANPFQAGRRSAGAIAQLVEGLEAGLSHQTLLGVTGSGKTFTIANVIQQVQRPTIVMAPNKTLAAQLYGEFREFFPNNAVEYFVSYYDYYQPEAYVP